MAEAVHPRKADTAKRQQWLKQRCHQLKHVNGAQDVLLAEMKALAERGKLSAKGRESLEAATTYFANQRLRMHYAEHVADGLPIGSGVTEAACKTLIKQRFCCSGMRWKETGLKTVLSLRQLVQTDGRWEQFWEKIDQYGAQPAL